MIKQFTDAWFSHKHLVQEQFTAAHPESYIDVVRAVVEMISAAIDGASGAPDPQHIHEIDDGGCQGTLVYVIGENDYQPDKYWYVKVGYGSCSLCDTLESIREYSDSAPTAEQIQRYMTLALHIVQGLREMGRTDA